MRLAALAVALVLPASMCRAAGTVDFDRIDRLMQQKPEIRDVLVRSLTMPADAFAQVRLGPEYQHLGGQRLGPYTFKATAKDASGRSILVTLCTSPRFLDAGDRVLPAGSGQELAATHVRELLDAVVLRDAGVSSSAACP